jgi:hypothetical protein
METWMKYKRSARTKRINAKSFGRSARDSFGPKCVSKVVEYTYREPKIQESGLHNQKYGALLF